MAIIAEQRADASFVAALDKCLKERPPPAETTPPRSK